MDAKTHKEPIARIQVIHDDGEDAIYDVREIRISPNVEISVQWGELVIRPIRPEQAE